MVTCPDCRLEYPYACEPDSQPAGKGRTILIVDDDEMLLDVVSQMLGFFGYRVLTAKTGKAALTIYRKRGDCIDLVLLDIMMPEMTGDVVFDRLKQIDPHVKVICVSGYCSQGIVQKMLTDGCCGYFPKPLSLSDLAGHISRILEEGAAGC
jgi:CheY-like chemotaxis protein